MISSIFRKSLQLWFFFMFSKYFEDGKKISKLPESSFNRLKMPFGDAMPTICNYPDADGRTYLYMWSKIHCNSVTITRLSTANPWQLWWLWMHWRERFKTCIWGTCHNLYCIVLHWGDLLWPRYKTVESIVYPRSDHTSVYQVDGIKMLVRLLEYLLILP